MTKIIRIPANGFSSTVSDDLKKDLESRYNNIFNNKRITTKNVNKFREEFKTVLTVNEAGTHTPLANVGNLITISAQKKAGKSIFSSLLVSAILNYRNKNQIICSIGDDAPCVLIVDAEQPPNYCVERFDLIQKNVNNDDLIDSNLFFLSFLDVPTELRLSTLQNIVYRHPKIRYVILDGIRDFVTSINDERAGLEVVNELRKFSIEKRLVIFNVLHFNKNNSELRGFLGSELGNKSDMTITLSRQKNYTVIKCHDSRGATFPDFAIDFTEVYNPNFTWNFPNKTHAVKVNEIPKGKPELQPSEKHIELIKKVFAVKTHLSKKELTQSVESNAMQVFGYTSYGRNNVGLLIKYLLEKMFIVELGEVYTSTTFV